MLSDINGVNNILRAVNMEDRCIVKDDSGLMVVDQEGSIVGTGYVKIKEDVAEIIFIAILPTFWHLSLGDCLVRALINFADRRDVKNLYVATKTNKAFFEKIGFKSSIEGEYSIHGGAYENDVGDNVLVLNIDEFFQNPRCHH